MAASSRTPADLSQKDEATHSSYLLGQHARWRYPFYLEGAVGRPYAMGSGDRRWGIIRSNSQGKSSQLNRLAVKRWGYKPLE
jgi:hypothetical protein